MTVCRNLNAVCQAGSKILNESCATSSITATYKPRWDQFGVGINRSPRPNIAVTKFPLFIRRNILLLRIAEAPDFIELQPLTGQVAKRFVLILSTDESHFEQEFCNSVF